MNLLNLLTPVKDTALRRVGSRWGGQTKVAPRLRRRLTAAGGAHEKTTLNEKRFDDVLQSAALLTDSGGEAVDADRPAAEAIEHGPQQLAVQHVQTLLIYL